MSMYNFNKLNSYLRKGIKDDLKGKNIEDTFLDLKNMSMEIERVTQIS